MPRRDDDYEDEDRPQRRSRQDDVDAPRRRRFEDEDDAPRPRQKGSNLGLILGILAGVLFLFCAGGGVAMYFVFRGVGGKVQDAADRMESSNNLKQIALACHNYESAHTALPNNSYGPDGKPLLSWRVHILPYIEEENLYRQFRTNEPWDSQHNIRLLSQMPRVYATPAQRQGKVAMGNTTYLLSWVFESWRHLREAGNAARHGEEAEIEPAGLRAAAPGSAFRGHEGRPGEHDSRGRGRRGGGMDKAGRPGRIPRKAVPASGRSAAGVRSGCGRDGGRQRPDVQKRPARATMARADHVRGW